MQEYFRNIDPRTNKVLTLKRPKVATNVNIQIMNDTAQYFHDTKLVTTGKSTCSKCRELAVLFCQKCNGFLCTEHCNTTDCRDLLTNWRE